MYDIGVQRHPSGLVGRLFRISDADTANHCVGHCWMKGRIREGDLVLCLYHGGDCFQYYCLVEEASQALTGIIGSKWGAYGLGERNGYDERWVITNEQFETLARGDTVYWIYPKGSK